MLKKYKKPLLVILILYITSSLIGCRNSDLGDDYVSNEDAQYMFMQSSLERYITKSDSGYYFLNGFGVFTVSILKMQQFVFLENLYIILQVLQ